MEKSKTSRALLVAPIFAGLLGFIFALLIAPRSGKQTRERLIKKAEDVKKQTQDGLANAKKTLKKNASDASDFKSRLIDAWKNSNNPAGSKGLNPTNDEDLKQSAHERNSVLSTWEE